MNDESENHRQDLLDGLRRFVLASRSVAGVRRIALVGSIVTVKHAELQPRDLHRRRAMHLPLRGSQVMAWPLDRQFNMNPEPTAVSVTDTLSRERSKTRRCPRTSRTHRARNGP